ncbi:MAG: MFS transporter [Nocardioides sp.]
MTLTAGLDVTLIQQRTIRTLVLAQAVGAVGITIGIATASLLARDLSGSESLAGLAQTFQVLGTAVASFLLARLMSRHGRRIGIMTGYLLGAAGSVLAVFAGVVGSMALLLVGAVLLGASSAANAGARYAATDLAVADRRARSLSTVVWATTIGAVLGPNLTGPSAAFADLLGIPELTGPFALGAIGMVLAAVVVGTLLRPDPLIVARELADVPPGDPIGTSWGRALAAVRERPVLAWAVVGLAGSHAAMIGVMVMTPLHMEQGGSELRIIGIVISVHVLGMFAFSPIVGLLADRLGRAFTLGCGGGILLVSLVLCAWAPEGSSWQVFGGLFLLGLGWSFATVSASTMIADHAPIEARTDVQGAADLVMGVTAAVAGGLAGLVVDLAGYPTLALATIALASGVVLAAIRAGRLAQLAR